VTLDAALKTVGVAVSAPVGISSRGGSDFTFGLVESFFVEEKCIN
jgi:hypothetical protein